MNSTVWKGIFHDDVSYCPLLRQLSYIYTHFRILSKFIMKLITLEEAGINYRLQRIPQKNICPEMNNCEIDG